MHASELVLITPESTPAIPPCAMESPDAIPTIVVCSLADQLLSQDRAKDGIIHYCTMAVTTFRACYSAERGCRLECGRSRLRTTKPELASLTLNLVKGIIFTDLPSLSAPPSSLALRGPKTRSILHCNYLLDLATTRLLDSVYSSVPTCTITICPTRLMMFSTRQDGDVSYISQ